MQTLPDKQIPVLLEAIVTKTARLKQIEGQIQKLKDEADYHQKALDMEVANLQYLLDPGCYLVPLPIGFTVALIAPPDREIMFYPVDFLVDNESSPVTD